VVALVGASCSDDPAGGGPTTTSAAVAEVSDLDHLAEQIVALHPDPYHHVDQAELDRRAGEDPADPDELLVAAMRLANLGPGDGHAGVYPWAQEQLEAWPLHLYEFPDGIRVVAGEGAPEGARLVSVGGAPIEEVADALRPLVPHDTEWTVRSRLPAYLVFPAVLRGLGFAPEELTWELPDGRSETSPPPETVPASDLRELLGLFQDQVPPTLPYDRGRLFWSERRGDAAYVRWNQVQSRDAGTRITDLGEALVDDVASGRVMRVVIDARHNPGGEDGAAKGLEDAVREIERTRPGTVRFLVGRGTFSAATLLINRVVADLGIALVGEPTGGSSRSFADARVVELPGSGIRAYVSTRLYEVGDAVFDPLEPDMPVEMTWDDWAAGRDPALAAALG
jgi:hypothetical protein